jgi:hypothetical protein
MSGAVCCSGGYWDCLFSAFLKKKYSFPWAYYSTTLTHNSINGVKVLIVAFFLLALPTKQGKDIVFTFILEYK